MIPHGYEYGLSTMVLTQKINYINDWKEQLFDNFKRMLLCI